jgi:hypothetical protein
MVVFLWDCYLVMYKVVVFLYNYNAHLYLISVPSEHLLFYPLYNNFWKSPFRYFSKIGVIFLYLTFHSYVIFRYKQVYTSKCYYIKIFCHVKTFWICFFNFKRQLFLIYFRNITPILEKYMNFFILFTVYILYLLNGFYGEIYEGHYGGSLFVLNIFMYSLYTFLIMDELFLGDIKTQFHVNKFDQVVFLWDCYLVMYKVVVLFI